MSPASLKLLKSDVKLKEMFKGIKEINRPKVFYRPYVLDRVLRNEEIDLLNDMRNQISQPRQN